MVRLGWWGGLDGVEGGGAVDCTSAMASCFKLSVIVLHSIVNYGEVSWVGL